MNFEPYLSLHTVGGDFLFRRHPGEGSLLQGPWVRLGEQGLDPNALSTFWQWLLETCPEAFEIAVGANQDGPAAEEEWVKGVPTPLPIARGSEFGWVCVF